MQNTMIVPVRFCLPNRKSIHSWHVHDCI